MDWNIEVFDRDLKRIAILEKAYNVGYTKEKNKLSTAEFTLMLKDEKNQYCTPFHYIRLYENGAYVDMFRIMPLEMVRDDTTSEITYRCEHVLGKLLDTTLFGYHEIGGTGTYTTAVLQYLIGKQKDWALGQCDFRWQFQYSWENENLLSALFSIPEGFEEEYRFTWDTTVYPWVVNLIKPATDVKAYLRYERNMKGVKKKEDGSVVCTRLYALGYGEGVNQLGIQHANPTKKPYIDADTIGKYGVIEKIWCDRRYQIEENLYHAAKAKLNRIKQPKITYEIEGLELWALTGMDADKFDEGDVVQVVDMEAGINIATRIVKKSKQAIESDYVTAAITISSDGESTDNSLADLYERAKINETNSQGATSINNYSFYGNCDAQYPAKIRFRIPEQAVNINRVDLSFQADSFRGYTKAIRSGGGTGGSTGRSGGESGTTGNNSTVNGVTDRDGSINMTVYSDNTRISEDEFLGVRLKDGLKSGTSGEIAIGKASSGTNHTHDYNPNHFHNVSIPGHEHRINVSGHQHDFTVPRHNHSFSTGDHSHSFSINDHTHGIEYGIYEGPSSSRFRVVVDGRTTSLTQAGDEFNIVSYMNKDSGGRIIRGWHEVLIYPDNLCRINGDVMVQVFVNSRGGDSY